jgi:hypothetical protein
MPEKVKIFFRKYERYISPVTLVFGFIFDNLTLQRIDVFYSNALLISYLVISALSIMILNIQEARRAGKGRSEGFHFALIFIMQFCMGGLFSASFLFYSKAGTIMASWPFLLLIVFYVIGNELMRHNYARLSFQVTVFFTALFSYLIFFIPIVLGKMGDSIFLLAGLASLMITGIFIYVVSWFAPDRTRKSAPMLALSLIGVFTAINALYFTNLIPPIPLALKDAGIYRSITRLPNGTYQTIGEEQNWFNIFLRNPTIHLEPGAPLYAFSAIFAPTSLSTNIFHLWQYRDEKTREWITASKIELSIMGGRDNGFRTFSVKENLFPGTWRVSVETPRGQQIGRLTFELAVPRGNEMFHTAIQ